MNGEKNRLQIKKLTFSALCLAMAMLLPLVTGHVPQIGSALSPMHIPVLLCGFICGWQWGLAVGFVSPLLRYVLFGMPYIYPTGIAMAFELAAYGVIAGVMYKLLPKRNGFIYVTLITAMVGGRVVWGAARFLLAGLGGSEFPFSAFLSGAITAAVPGIILHIVLIPVLVMALKHVGLILND